MKRKVSNGGTTFWLQQFDVVSDIDVKPGVKSVLFTESGLKMAGSKSPNIFFQLKNVKKQFPDVEQLVIDTTIGSGRLELSNFMFPNVRRIVSTNIWYESGPLLVQSFYRNGHRHLLNTFRQAEDSVLDLKGITSVQTYAFSGCLAKQITNTQKITWIDEHAFSGSAFRLANTSCLVGTLLVAIDPNAKEVCIPSNTTAVARDIDFAGKRIILQDYQQVFLLSPKQCMEVSSIFVYKICHQDFRSRQVTAPGLEVSADNPWYSSLDGILYTKDKRKLVYCPAGKTGTVVLPEGLIEILPNAFQGSNVEAIQFPDSLDIIRAGAFQQCMSLKRIKFGQHLKTIEESCFSRCDSLMEVEIPPSVQFIGQYAFYASGLEDVIFHNGMQYIENNAFCSCHIHEVQLPGSVQRIGAKAFYGVASVLTERYIPGLVQALCIEANTTSECYPIRLQIGEAVTYLASGIGGSMLHALDFYLSTCQDAESIHKTYEYAPSTWKGSLSGKIAIALDIYKETKDKTVAGYLKRVGKTVVEGLAKSAKEQELIQFIQYGFLPQTTLRAALKAAEQAQLAIAAAYALQELNKTKKTPGLKL